MMNPKGLTATIIFEAQSLNYDEGYGNLSVLKKLHRADGRTYTYSSRQSLRYSIFNQGCVEHGWAPSQVEKRGGDSKGVVQIISSIVDSQEADLFGFMQTDCPITEGEKPITCTLTRVSPVKLSPAISLEAYDGDIEMLTNKFQSDKIFKDPNIANIEQHKSLYAYTLCVDLHRVGSQHDEIQDKIMPHSDKNLKKKEFQEFMESIRNTSIGNDKKAQRVTQLLDIVSSLYRNIRGRREDLKPLFIIGGVYDRLNPFFENTIKINYDKAKPTIMADTIKQQIFDGNLKDHTVVGYRSGIFENNADDFGISTQSPENAIKGLKTKVSDYYNSQ